MRQPPDQLYDNAPRSTHWSEKVTSTLTSMARRKASPISSSTFPLRMLRSSLAVLNLTVLSLNFYVSANRVATVIANEWKDENDKFMPSGWKIED
ncbi:hypothetical protein Prudu_010676 [Prunus dulcis]|uniref:Uncharacterized protein n=1 Tax=Prunus dulcis TaxID=3755 RepID=A0A4Y1R9L6_PRUDU|nr:hypothetical protein Prudu_010676 [Prunus dulcis]